MLAKLDSSEHKKITDKYGVKGFPTMLFFYNGDYVEYKGNRE
jgi:protein disulfide-isomerase/protein disulfide-isomerase A1